MENNTLLSTNNNSSSEDKVESGKKLDQVGWYEVQRAVKYFNEKGYSHRNVSSVKAKLESILRRYSEAYAKKNSTGFGDSDHISREGQLERIYMVQSGMPYVEAKALLEDILLRNEIEQ
ncbi:hypothetical protein HPULCUR_010771 [Helicostylum pulchrum]|uniref:Uncharacterized protein n=1 Tax=Helicostylum pulchrum TaxID=562976 RepID=A0ABP9YE68_9FUNG